VFQLKYMIVSGNIKYMIIHDNFNFNLLKDANFAVKNGITLVYMHMSKNVYKHSLFTSC
jgi:hypothetical protein